MEKVYTSITVKIPKELALAINAIVDELGVRKSDIMREALIYIIKKYCESKGINPKELIESEFRELSNRRVVFV